MKAPGKLRITAVLALVMLVVATATTVQAKTNADQVLTARTFIDLAKKVRPAVVSIKINVETRKKIEEWKREQEARPRAPKGGEEPDIPDWLKDFFDIQPMPSLPDFKKDWFRYPYGAGTGMIVRSDGYILTNRHVLFHPMFGKMFKDGQITVVLADKRKFEGDKVKLVATDPLTDLAILKIDATDLPTIRWGNSDELQIGEWVMAIGDPLELTGSVSQGIISGMGREIDIAGYARLLQTTAVINPGNSGGPLVNLNGEVIGINNAIASNTRYWQGVGFAIPSNLASKTAKDLIEAGHPVRGYIGIRMTDPSEFPALAAHEGYEGENGVGVVDVYEGYPAAKAGLKPYDIIVEINGRKVTGNVMVQRLITGVRPGDKIEIKVFRGGKYKTLTLTAGEWPSEKELAALTEGGKGKAAPGLAEEQPQKGRLGLEVEDYPDNPNAPDEEKAVVITQVQPGSAAASAGLQAGDVIFEAEKQRVHNAAEFAKLVKDRLAQWDKSGQKKEGETLVLKIRRGERTQLVFVPLPTD